MTRTFRGAVLLAFVAAAGLRAQDPRPWGPDYAETIEVRVVDVDVVVTDRNGRPIPGLERDAFELYEDGRRVEIEYFSRVAGGRIADVPVHADEPAVPEPRVPLTWVVFVDQTNLSPQRRNYAMRQLQQFLRRALSKGDRGLVALNDGRSFRIRQGLTDDPALLMETLAKMEKERMAVNPSRHRVNALLNQMRRSEQEMGVPAATSRFAPRDESEFLAQTAGGEITALIAEEAARTKAAMISMGALLDAVARIPGRLALVYLGAGFNTLPAADLVTMWSARYGDFSASSFAPRPEEERDRIEREITRLYDNLSALRVAVYTIHAGDPGAGTSVEDPGQMDISKSNATDIASLNETAYAQEMARRTGGLYFKVTPSLSNQLETVIRDFEDYYSLGYRPEGAPGKARNVTVKVKADGARVRHREMVRERTRTEQAAGDAVAETVDPQPRVAVAVRRGMPAGPRPAPTEANPLGIAVEADRPTRVGFDGPQFLTFDFSIDLGALSFVSQPEGLRAEFVMHFVLVGTDGAVYPLESREQSLTIPRSDVVPDADAISYAWHVDLAPLRLPDGIPVHQKGLRLTVSVIDRTSGVRSVLTVPVGGAESAKK